MEFKEFLEHTEALDSLKEQIGNPYPGAWIEPDEDEPERPRHRLNWYGYYCGPGPPCPPNKNFKKDPDSPEPMDSIDAICQSHDQDYCDCGKDWRAFFGNDPCVVDADKRFVKTLRVKAATDKNLTTQQKKAARFFANFFAQRRGFDRDRTRRQLTPDETMSIVRYMARKDDLI